MPSSDLFIKDQVMFTIGICWSEYSIMNSMLSSLLTHTCKNLIWMCSQYQIGVLQSLFKNYVHWWSASIRQVINNVMDFKFCIFMLYFIVELLLLFIIHVNPSAKSFTVQNMKFNIQSPQNLLQWNRIHLKF